METMKEQGEETTAREMPVEGQEEGLDAREYTKSNRTTRIKVRYVQRWYTLLVDCGLSEVLQKMTAAMLNGSHTTRRPVTAEEQQAAPVLTEEVAMQVAADVDMWRIASVFGEQGRFVEFAATIMQTENLEAVEDMDMGTLQEEFPFFIAASLQPMFMLKGFAGNMA